MEEAARPTRYQHTSAEAKALLAAGESGRFEFKRDANAIEPATLAALANWVALDPSREVAHLLVGVDEETDRTTGLTYGVVYGLPKGLEKSVARLLNHSSSTYPIPVDLHIVEEAVDEDHPFLRVEVRPTMAPHYDGKGRRQTRQGRSTRAMTDDELLQVYLDREAGTSCSLASPHTTRSAPPGPRSPAASPPRPGTASRPATRCALASWGGTAGSRWWGRPDWEDHARAIADHFGLNQYRTRQLIREPWKLPFEMREKAIEYQKHVQYRH